MYREALRQGRPEEFALDMAQVAAAREALEASRFSNPRVEEEVWRVFNSLLASADSYFVQGIRELTPRGHDRMRDNELGALNLTAQDLRDDESGYFAAIYRNRATGDYLVANRGSENGTDRRDWQNNHEQFWALGSAQYQQAIHVAQTIMSSGVRAYNVSFTGHSLGGGLAQAQSVVTGAHAVVFDAAGIRYETVSDFVSRETFDWNRNNRVHRFSAPNDPLTRAHELKDVIAFGLTVSEAQLRRENYAVGTFGEFVGRDGPLAQLPDEIASLSVQEGIRRLREGPGAGPHWVLPSAHMTDSRGAPFAATGSGGADGHSIGLLAAGVVRASYGSFSRGGLERYDSVGRNLLWGDIHR